MPNKFFEKKTIALTAVLILVLGLTLYHWKKTASKREPVRSAAQSAPLFDPGDKPMTIVLKGVESTDGKWVNTTAVIRKSKSRYNQMKQAILAYLNGPRSGKVLVPVPEGMALNEFYWTPQGMAVADLSLGGVDREKFGFIEEALFVRGLIDTLTGNFFEVKQVRLLVDGQDAETLAGHYALGTSEADAPVTGFSPPLN